MSDNAASWPHSRLAFQLVVAAWVLYTFLTLMAPGTGDAKYGMTGQDLVLLRLTIIVPILIIWGIAIRGACAFKTYASMLKGSPESPGLSLMADGLIWLVAYLVASSLLAGFDPFITSAHFIDAFILIRDHVPPLIGLGGFILLYLGSNRLKAIAPFKTWTSPTFVMLGAFVLFSIVFVLEFTSTPTGRIAGMPITSTSVWPLGVLLVTLILPYLAAWFIGILAAMNIYKYSRSVHGILYRRALSLLVRGVVTVVLFATVVQAISFADRFLTGLSLGTLLLLVYAFVVFYALGFVFIWMGAKQLKHLEALE